MKKSKATNGTKRLFLVLCAAVENTCQCAKAWTGYLDSKWENIELW